ncbi:hypothetical protein [Paenibacillus sp. NPDC058071]|uniref:hypothetical protein n=1 Tax=Paenibacillus sp. NPDC058071 TaxID=3346326 RepID=UPI0036DC7272
MKQIIGNYIGAAHAYFTSSDNLKGREFLIARTMGGSEKQYRAGGDNLFTLSEYLRPIQGTFPIDQLKMILKTRQNGMRSM